MKKFVQYILICDHIIEVVIRQMHGVDHEMIHILRLLMAQHIHSMDMVYMYVAIINSSASVNTPFNPSMVSLLFNVLLFQ